MLRASGGSLEFDGRALDALPRRQTARRIAYVPQSVDLVFPIRSLDLVLQGRAPHGNGFVAETAEDFRRAREAMRACDVEALAERDASALSGGERRRVFLARALCQEAEVWLLDEPTAGLDPRHGLEFLETLWRVHRERGTTVLLVTHDIGLAAGLASSVLLLKAGRTIARGPRAEVLTAGEPGAGLRRPVRAAGSPLRGAQRRPAGRILRPLSRGAGTLCAPARRHFRPDPATIRSLFMWFKKDRAPKEPREGRQSKVPEGLWVKCDSCRQILYNKELARNFKICPKCGFHFRLSAPERLRMLFDDEEYVELDTNLRSSDPLKFRDSKKYRDRLRDAEDNVGPSDAIVVGSGTLEGIPVVIGAMEFFFMAGSMGSVVGEKIARAAERALAERKPLIIVSTSGGARMQEGILSLMQMGKISAALARLAERGSPTSRS